jgi:hypothetical protein
MGPQALRTGYKIDAYRHFSPHEAQYSVHHPRWPENRGLVCVICPWCVSLLDSGNFGLADAQLDARREFDLSPRALLSADREALKRALFVILHFQVLQPHCMSMMTLAQTRTIEETCTVYAIQLCYAKETMQAQMFE